MTRDEAYKVATDGYGTCGSFSSGPRAFVDIAVALGMLKLEEPKSIEERLKDAFFWSGNTFSAALKKLDEAGLKIVEK